MSERRRPTQHALSIKILIATALSLSLTCGSGNAFAATSDAKPTGKWKGQWKSETTGHHGPLKAKIKALDNGHYRAIFAGRFFKIIPFIYPTKLERIAEHDSGEQDSAERLRSVQRLPLLGTYRMDASVTEDKFHAEYKSKRDVGTFKLSR